MINNKRFAILVNYFRSFIRIVLPIAKPCLKIRCANIKPLFFREICRFPIWCFHPFLSTFILLAYCFTLGMYLIAVGARHSRNIVCRRVVVDIINIKHFSRSLTILCYDKLIILNLEHRLAISSPHFGHKDIKLCVKLCHLLLAKTIRE